MKVGALVEGADPRFESGEKITFEAEAHIDGAGPMLAGFFDEAKVFGKLGVAHADVGRDAIGQGAMAGEDDALEAALVGGGGEFGGGAEGVAAEGGMRMGLPTHGLGFSDCPGRPRKPSLAPAAAPRRKWLRRTGPRISVRSPPEMGC